MDDEVGGHFYVPSYLGAEGGECVAECQQADVLQHRLLQLGQLAVAVHKGGQPHARVADGLDALFIGASLDVGAGQVGLADAAYGRGGIHYLMCQHACEALPRLHLPLGHKFLYFLSHVVERLLQGPFAKEQSLCGQPEGEVAVAYGIVHQPGTVAEQALVPVDCRNGHDGDEGNDCCNGWNHG